MSRQAPVGLEITPDISSAIDATRGLAALGVIWGHSMYGLQRPVELNGAFWVWVFLPISGYLVARGFMTGYGDSVSDAVRFLRNRFLRIVPLAWVALACGGLMTAVAGEWPVSAWRQFLFVPVKYSMSLVGPLWTVATELQFYVVAAIVAPWLRRGGVWRRVLVTSVLVAVSLWVARAWIDAGWDNDVQPRGLVANLPFFLWGAWLATAPGRWVMPRALKMLLVVAGVGVAWYLQNFKADYFWRWGTYPDGVYGGAAACALFVSLVALGFGAPSGPAPLWWRRGPLAWGGAALRWCGVRTYGIYVVHAVLLSMNLHFVRLPNGLGKFAFLLLALPIAALSFHTLEPWFLRWKQPRRAHVNGAPV